MQIGAMVAALALPSFLASALVSVKWPWWLLPGISSLCLFAYLLTQAEAEHAGRTYAAYGGVYIVSVMLWLWAAEGIKPDRWDALGAAVCLIGAALILGTANRHWRVTSTVNIRCIRAGDLFDLDRHMLYLEALLQRCGHCQPDGLCIRAIFEFDVRRGTDVVAGH